MASYTVRPVGFLLWAWRLRGAGPEQRGFALTKARAKRAAERAAARAAPPPKPRPPP
jgi:hypothetical protein